MKLKDKVALVTGGGSGIGKAAALLLAKEGAKVGVLGHGETDEEQQVADQIKRDVGTARVVKADISDAQAMERATQQVIDAWGRLDILFANAGINGMWAPVE